jgi:tight adherence protein B
VVIQSYLAIIGLVIVFAVTIGIGQGFYWTYISRKEMEREQLARRLGTMTHEEVEALLFKDRAVDAAANALGSVGMGLQQTLRQAESNSTVGQLLIRSVGVGIVLAILLGIILGRIGLPFALIGAFLPYLLIRSRAKKRGKMLLEQLPEALDLMSRSLQAGLGLSDAFKLAAEEMPMPLAGEFGRIFEEIRYGREYRMAMGGLVERNPQLFELRIFVSSVLLQRETGGNLIEILNTISSTVRNRFVFDAKVRALTAEAKFSAMILGGLPIGVGGMLAFSNPTYLFPLFSDPWGHIMLAMFILLYAVGGFFMYSISKVDV